MNECYTQRTDELLAEERVVNANNVGAFYKCVFKRTTNHSNIGVVMDKKMVFPSLMAKTKLMLSSKHVLLFGRCCR